MKENEISIIPRPVELKNRGGYFTIDSQTSVFASKEAGKALNFFLRRIASSTGVNLRLGGEPADESPVNSIVLISEPAGSKNEEAYSLDVSGKNIVIKAAFSKGFLNGISSLFQLMPADVWRSAPVSKFSWKIPSVFINDRPRFKWRGMHLDAARYYMPKEFIRKFIDLLAIHKFNVLHWHLTDDQGWRIEIKKYPKLTKISSVRKETIAGHHSNRPRLFDGIPHGGFYSKDDMREIAAYADALGITVLPEIEMPGHTQAVLAAYPELGCTGGPYEVSTIWSIREDIFCAGNEKVFSFLEDVLSEVMELFPSKYIHIGGDEAPKKRWEKCPKCQARMRKENLKDEHELQSWFIRRIEKFLNAKGRRLIGWDEILEGGLAPNATVMSWRGEEGGIKALKAGHDVVFAPNKHTYFDYYQTSDQLSHPVCIGGCLTLENVYAYNPAPKGLSKREHAHILGAQGQLWTEYMPTPKHVEFMAFPRMCALSEVLWSPEENRDFKSFTNSLERHLKRLDVMDVNYAKI
jgi:hexosaminidase